MDQDRCARRQWLLDMRQLLAIAGWDRAERRDAQCSVHPSARCFVRHPGYSDTAAPLLAQRWHELGPPPLSARDSREVASAGAVEEALMAIVAGFDVHRAQITFDALDSDSGEVMRGRIDATPAAVTRWVKRFAGREMHVAVEACTGWLFVCDALAAAGAVAHSPSRWRRARCGVASGARRPIARTRAGCVSCSPRAACRRRGSRRSMSASGARGRGCATP